jgi:hypothetical protein
MCCLRTNAWPLLAATMPGAGEVSLKSRNQLAARLRRGMMWPNTSIEAKQPHHNPDGQPEGFPPMMRTSLLALAADTVSRSTASAIAHLLISYHLSGCSI